MGLLAEARVPEGTDRLLVPVVEKHGSAIFSDREATGCHYAALLTSEAITDHHPVIVQPMYTVERWL